MLTTAGVLVFLLLSQNKFSQKEEMNAQENLLHLSAENAKRNFKEKKWYIMVK